MSTHYYRGPIKQQPTSYVNDALTDEEFSQILQLQEIQAHEEALRQPREDTTDDEMLAKMLHKQLNRPSDASRTQAKKEEEYLTQKFLKEEAQERQRKLDTKEYPCDICFGDVLVSDLYIIDACNHRFCRGCMHGHIMSRVTDIELVDNVTCPSPNCKHKVDYTQIKHILSRKEFDQYDSMLLKKNLDSNPNSRYCPGQGCGGLVLGDPERPLLTCPQCNLRFCFNCKVPWHDNYSCQSYQETKQDDADRAIILQNVSGVKPCPKCHAVIQKNEGCKHMTCKCGFQFCWVCNQNWPCRCGG